ncbi:MAG TPA: TOPRIM nucleotidyl transferase/hydrolase domain-containing protein, partial [Candidatus Obscuribacterales bacterium]
DDSFMLTGSMPASFSDWASLTFSLLFALSEIERFRPIAFRRSSFALAEADGAWTSKGRWMDSVIDDFSAQAAATFELTDDQLAWLHLSLALVPDCNSLRDLEDTKEDARFKFIYFVTDKIERELRRGFLSADQLLRADHFIAMARELQSAFNQSLLELRSELPADFLANALMLVEGPTEAVLIPHFAQRLHCGLSHLGCHLIASGGANQVVRRYLYWREMLTTPVACVLDGDAHEARRTVEENRRELDILSVLRAGEIEDAIDLPLFVELLNAYIDSLGGVNSPFLVGSSAVRMEDFDGHQFRKPALKRIFRERGLGTFDKVDFAKFVSEHFSDAGKIPDDIRILLRELKVNIERWQNERRRQSK